MKLTRRSAASALAATGLAPSFAAQDNAPETIELTWLANGAPPPATGVSFGVLGRTPGCNTASVEPPAVLQTIEAAPNVSANYAAQWSLTAIEVPEMCGGTL